MNRNKLLKDISLISFITAFFLFAVPGFAAETESEDTVITEISGIEAGAEESDTTAENVTDIEAYISGSEGGSMTETENAVLIENDFLMQSPLQEVHEHMPVTVPGYSSTYLRTGLTDSVVCSSCDTVLTEAVPISCKDPGKTLKPGDNGDSVLEVQSALAALGYLDASSVTGYFNNEMKAAVTAFQARNGLEGVDGLVGNWTLGKLRGTPASFRTLQKGLSGTDVRVLQNTLKKAGFFTLMPDGIYGNGTAQSVCKFQLYNGLNITGTADQATLLKLYNSPVSFRNLSTGMSGNDVRNIQTYLYEKGYLTVTPDGAFGKLTKNAVMMFQAANGLKTADGVFNSWCAERVASGNASVFGKYYKGSSGAAVLLAQKKLKEKGYFTATPDAGFGNVTYLSLIKFQLYNGLVADGCLNIDTMSRLMDDNAVEWRVLRSGMSGPDVMAVQQRLYDLGYLFVVPDGAFGKLTQAAIYMFQAANGLMTPDGMFGDWSAEHITENKAKVFGKYYKGSSGAAVLLAQKKLKEKGYFTAVPDAGFGSITYASLVKFQLYNGLPADGCLNIDTMRLLMDDNAVKWRVLRSGMSGPDVKAVQQRLYDLGYLSVVPDGGFGALTKTAIYIFQAENGIAAPDGAFGNMSAEKMTDINVKKFYTLQNGSSGNAVMFLQNVMKKAYVLKASPDGWFGNLTESSVKIYQRSNGLTEDGIVDLNTFYAILNNKLLTPVMTDFTSSGSGNITVSWTPVPGAAQYAVYRAEDQTTSPTYEGEYKAYPKGYVQIATVSGDKTSYTDTAVRDRTIYEYTIKALNGDRSGDYDPVGIYAYTKGYTEIYDYRIKNLTEKGFTVTGRIVNNAGIRNIQGAVWSENNGQDDLKWVNASVSGESFSLSVLTSDHKNDSGIYHIHIYVTDNKGLQANEYQMYVEVPVKKAPPVIKNPLVIYSDENSFEIGAVVSASSGIAVCELTAYPEALGSNSAKKQALTVSGNTVRASVNRADFGGIGGTYVSELLITDNIGISASYRWRVNMEKPDHEMSLTQIDVGHGDAALLESNGEYLLIDCGRSEMSENVANVLNTYGIKDIAILLTHRHSDHTGGIVPIFENFNVTHLYINEDYCCETFNDEIHTAQAVSALRNAGVPVTSLKAGDALNIGHTVVSVLGPTKTYTLADNALTNNRSLWLSITDGISKYLLIGDAEYMAEKDLLDVSGDLSAEYVKVPHHGYATSSSTELIKATSPEITVTSMNMLVLDTDSGKIVKKRWEGAAKENYLTGKSGSVTVRALNGRLSVYAYEVPV